MEHIDILTRNLHCYHINGRSNGWRIMETLKVSAHSKAKAPAGALAAVIRTNGAVELQAIGAGAVNQAIKAMAAAGGYVAPDGINRIVTPLFVEVAIANEERTAIKFTVKSR